MHPRLLTALACLFALTAPARPTLADPDNRPPNIIYIYADDLGYGELGSYGQAKIKTPHLDKPAAQGFRQPSFSSPLD